MPSELSLDSSSFHDIFHMLSNDVKKVRINEKRHIFLYFVFESLTLQLRRTFLLATFASTSPGKDTSEFSKYLGLGSDGNGSKPELLALNVNSRIADWHKCGFNVTDDGAIDCGNMYISVNQTDRIDEDQRTHVTSLGWAGIDNFTESQILNYDIQKIDKTASYL